MSVETRVLILRILDLYKVLITWNIDKNKTHVPILYIGPYRI